MIEFKTNGHLTLGVEIELQLLDPQTLDMKPVAQELFELTKATDKIKPESFLSMVEVTTGICHDVKEAGNDLRASFALLKEAAHKVGARIASTGTHPFAKYAEKIPYPSERIRYLIDRNQWISRRMMVCGLHVHVGMRDGDTAIRFNNFFLHFVPHLIALSSSSPFWQGEDTGLASWRSTIFESCPTAGHPCRLKNWYEFSDLCGNLIRTKAISSHKDLWWDIRPSPDFGTIEIRVCDGLATLDDALAITALIHLLGHWYEQHSDYDAVHHAPYMWMMRENKWRAVRYGLEADIIVDDANTPVRNDLESWLEILSPLAAQMGYEAHMQRLRAILQLGTSAERQRKVFAATDSLEAVAAHNADECEANAPKG